MVDGADDFPNWDPIGQGGDGETWVGQFEGNGHTIANLTITSSSEWHIGLFGYMSSSSSLSRLGLPDVNINLTSTRSHRAAAAVAGTDTTTLRYVWATGNLTITGGIGHTQEVGGLVSFLYNSAIYGSWSDVDLNITAETARAGGLGAYFTGVNTVTAAYATGEVSANCVTTTCSVWGGGLFGGGSSNTTTITAAYANNRVSALRSDGSSGTLGGIFAPDPDFANNVSGNIYWNVQTSGISDSDMTDSVIGSSTSDLQTPMDYTGTYSGWNVDVDGISGNDDPWNFGAVDQYPVLKFGRSADAIAAQFTAQSPGVPQGVTLTAKLDTLVVRWSAVNYATGYKVQWKSGGQSYNMTDRQDTVSVGSDTTHAIANLTNGTLYTVRVLATKTGGADSAPSDEVMGGPGIRYDRDGNGLIEIGTLAQLNAIRWDLNGDGALDAFATTSDTTAYRAAFLNARSGMGCPGGTCTGYELTTDLTFPPSGDYSYWSPIGGGGRAFNATFDGNGHTLTGLRVSITTSHAGLFLRVFSNARIKNVGIINPNIRSTAGQDAAALVGRVEAGAQVDACYVSGGRIAVAATGGNGGGLVGWNAGTIRASYSTAEVTSEGYRSGVEVGGLVGYNLGGTIRTSYAAGPVSGSGPSSSDFGGLVGLNAFRNRNNRPANIFQSYCDTTATRRTTCVGYVIGSNTIEADPLGTGALQMPTGYTGIYENWNIDLDGVTGNDDPWDFGAADQYPVLKIGRDAATIAAQFTAQPPGVPQGVTLTALRNSLIVRWSAVSNATGYKVQWKSGRENYAASRQSLVSGTRDTILSLTGGTAYTVRVIATKTGGPDSRPSAERYAPPGVPGNVMVTPQVLALRVAWDAAPGADGYKVQWKAGDQAYAPATREYAVGGTDATIVGLTAGTPYTVRVLATREHAADGPASSEVTGTPLALPTLSIGMPNVAEGAAGAMDTLRFVVTLSHASQSEVTVAYADARTGSATSGTDYTALAAGTLTIAAGALSDTLAVSVIGDGMDEPDETVVITLSSPANAIFARNAGTLTGTGRITDDDSAVATLVLSPASISENGGKATVTAILSSAVTAAVTITVSAMEVPPAVAGDFSLLPPAMLTIAAGQTTSTGLVTITAIDNQVSAPTKSVTVSGTADAANTVADPVAVTLLITDDESPQVTLALSSASILENGGMATVTAMLDRTAPTATTITVSATAVAPAEAGDFSVSTAKTLTIAANGTTSTGVVTITAQDDTLDAPDKSVTVSGTADGGNNATAPRPVTLTIADDDDPPMLSIESPSMDEGNTGSAPLQFGVMLSAASERQITVAYAMGTGTATAGEDYTALAAGTLTFAPGTASQTLAVSIIGDETDEPDETVIITLRDPTNATFTGGATALTGTGTITNDDPVVVTLILSSESISEAGGITTVTATLSTPENAAVTITVSATPEGHAIRGDFSLSTPATLTIAANGTTSTGLVTITAKDNADDAPDKSVTVSGTADDAANVVPDPISVTLTITDDNDGANLDVDGDGTADLTDAIMVILYLFGLENEGITNYILFSQQATRTDPEAVTAYIKTLITTGRIDIDADGTVDLTDIIMVILYLFGLENEGITDYILFSQQATRTDPQEVTAYIASLLP